MCSCVNKVLINMSAHIQLLVQKLRENIPYVLNTLAKNSD